MFNFDSMFKPISIDGDAMSAMSAMKDHMYEFIKFMNGERADNGFEISTKQLKQKPGMLNNFRQKNGIQPQLHIVGSMNEKDDGELMALVTRHFIDTTEKLNLSRLKFNIAAETLQVFPLIKEVTFRSCSAVNANILRFNLWCPAVEKLTFESMQLSTAAYNAFISSDQTFPNVKTLVLNLKDSSLKLTRELLSALNKQFPLLETLELTLEANDKFSQLDPKYNVPYQPMHFRKLKKLYVRAFAGDIDKLFDYMAIFNNKLKEFSFAGMITSPAVIEWIKKCKKLVELTVDCQFLDEFEMCEVKDMQSLTKATLSAKKLDWSPNKIIQFARGNPNLTELAIDSDYFNEKLVFGNEYKTKCMDLIKQRGKLMIKVFFHEKQREITASENGFTRKN